MQKTWVWSWCQEDSPGRGNGNPLQWSCQENPMDRAARQAVVHGVAKESDATEQLNNNKIYSPSHSMLCCTQSLQPHPTLCSPMDRSPPGSSVHGVLQARILEWVAMLSSRGSSQPRDRIHISCVSCFAGRFFTTEPPGQLSCTANWQLSTLWFKMSNFLKSLDS